MKVSFNICAQHAVWRAAHVIRIETNQRKREFFSTKFWRSVPESRILFRIPKPGVEIDKFSSDREGQLRALQLPSALSNTFSPRSPQILSERACRTRLSHCVRL